MNTNFPFPLPLTFDLDSDTYFARFKLLKEEGRKIIDEKILPAKEKYIPDIANCKTHDEYKNTLTENDYDDFIHNYYYKTEGAPLDDYVRDMTDSDRRKILDEIFMKLDIEEFTKCLNALDGNYQDDIRFYYLERIDLEKFTEYLNSFTEEDLIKEIHSFWLCDWLRITAPID